MKANVYKTKIVIFSKGRRPRNLHFNYNGTNTEIVKDVNYLGIDLSRTGSFRVCKNYLYEKAIKAMYEVIKRGENIIFLLDVNVFDKLMKAIL